jgi:hypothetical protein
MPSSCVVGSNRAFFPPFFLGRLPRLSDAAETQVSVVPAEQVTPFLGS